MINCWDALADPQMWLEIDVLSRRTDLGGYEGRILFWRARIAAQRSREYRDALDLMRRALAKGLPPTEAAIARAFLAETIPDAITHLQEAVKSDPSNFRAYEQLLFMLILAGRKGEAREKLAQLEVLRPKSPPTLVSRAFLDALDGNLAAAEATLTGLEA